MTEAAAADAAGREIIPAAPFRLDLTAWTLRRRAGNNIDRWDGAVYRRALFVPGTSEPVELSVRQTDSGGLRVAGSGSEGAGGARQAQMEGVATRLLGLNCELSGFYAMAAGDADLGPLVARFRGVKPPRFPTLFEALANAIACQQVTLTLGITLLNRLAAAYGRGPGDGSAAAGMPGASAGDRGPRVAAFPRPEDIAGLAPEDLRGLGFSRQKGRALIDLAAAVLDGTVDESRLVRLDDGEAARALQELRGIGRWSAEYALLRGLGRLSVFPGDDVGAQHNLQRWLGLPRLDYASVKALAARWQPYAGLVYFHLLLANLEHNEVLRTG